MLCQITFVASSETMETIRLINSINIYAKGSESFVASKTTIVAKDIVL